MSRALLVSLVLPFCALLVLSGCGKPQATTGHDDHDESAHAQEEGDAPARFKEGQGLQLATETSSALGLKTAEIEERSVKQTYDLTMSVFDAGPPARASSLVPLEIADALAQHPPSEARLLAVRRELSAALTQVEIVFALPGTPEVGSTVSLTLRGPARHGAAVPKTALLQTATGTFVYVVNGVHLLRTPVKTGANDGEYIEVLDGLYSGDVIAITAVEQLWLTELRLTKGGGHSH